VLLLLHWSDPFSAAAGRPDQGRICNRRRLQSRRWKRRSESVMRHLNNGDSSRVVLVELSSRTTADMSPQVLPTLRRHSSSAATFSSSNNDGGKDQSYPRRPVRRSAPGRPPPPVATRAALPVPLPVRQPQQTDVYVTSTSRICLARSLDGLVPSSVDDADKKRVSPSRVNVHALRNVSFDLGDDPRETQVLVCWIEGSCVCVCAAFSSSFSVLLSYCSLFLSGLSRCSNLC